jgi:Uma2 family endonuclease
MATVVTDESLDHEADAEPAAAALPFPATWTLADLQKHLGVPAERIRIYPSPGFATEEDVIRADDHEDRLCELIDGVLVEKAVGQYESKIAAWVIYLLNSYLVRHPIGDAFAPDGPMRVAPKQIRMPDVAFVTKERARTDEAIVPVSPDLAIEILSRSNRPKEMRRKLKDYFAGGTRLVWYIDPKTWTAKVYTSPTTESLVASDGILDGGDVLPGFKLSLADLFAKVGPRG